MTTLQEFEAQKLQGEIEPLAAYAGKVVLIVNVASQCGSTPHYEWLEGFYEKYGPDDFAVLGFPCNQFGDQEPGDDAEIADFCTSVYGVRFPMFSKIEVNGANADPLYRWLKKDTPESADADIEWNFVKFLVDRDGKPIRRYDNKVPPEVIAADIEKLL